MENYNLDPVLQDDDLYLKYANLIFFYCFLSAFCEQHVSFPNIQSLLEK